MKEYKSEDSFHITGRGQVFTMKDISTENTPEKGEQVLIDGKVYEVAGVEKFYKMVPGAKQNIGILVKNK